MKGQFPELLEQSKQYLAGPLFNLSPHTRHTFEALPHPACGQVECMEIFLPTFAFLPHDAKLKEWGCERASARSF